MSSKTKIRSVTGVKLALAVGALLMASSLALVAIPSKQKKDNQESAKNNKATINNKKISKEVFTTIKPDLVVNNITVTTLKGNRRKVDFIIKNQGIVSTRRPFDVELYRIDGEGKFVVLSNWVEGLDPGETKSFSQEINYSEYIEVEIDHDKRINESSERNNTKRRLTDMADLEIVSFSFEPKESYINSRGFLWLIAKVRNSGNLAAENVIVNISDQFGWGGEVGRAVHDAGREINYLVELRPREIHLARNPHNFIVTIDPDRVITESNENNNKYNAPTINIQGYLKTAIIQFKMPDTDLPERDGMNIIDVMNNPDDFSILNRFDHTYKIHSLYYFDRWWRNQRLSATGVDRDVFRSDILGVFDLNEYPPRRPRRTDCGVNLEPFFDERARAAGVNLDEYDNIIYLFYDHYRNPEDPIFGENEYYPNFAACAMYGRKAFMSIPTNLNNMRDDYMKLETLLHESGHVLGIGQDNYTSEPLHCLDPEGLPEPNKIPKFPQNFACLMCPKIVLDQLPYNRETGEHYSENVLDVDSMVVCEHGESIIWP